MRDRGRRLPSGLVADLEALLYRHDPIGIAFGDNLDEYSPEAAAIVPRLADARSSDDVQAVVHDVFAGCFDDKIAGPASRYRAIAVEIWTLLGP